MSATTHVMLPGPPPAFARSISRSTTAAGSATVHQDLVHLRVGQHRGDPVGAEQVAVTEDGDVLEKVGLDAAAVLSVRTSTDRRGWSSASSAEIRPSSTSAWTRV